MKKIILLLVLLSASFPIFAQNCDTTFYANLSSEFKRNEINFKCRTEQIKMVEDGNEYPVDICIYKLTLENKSLTDTFFYSAGCPVIDIIDINKTDNSKEILITNPGMDEGYSCNIYVNSNGPKLLCKVDFCSSFEPDGKGNLYIGHWMGFCSIADKYVLSDDGEKITGVKMDFYPVKIDYIFLDPNSGDYTTRDYGVVAGSFELLAERNKNSKVVAKTNPGERIYITGLDTTSIKTKEKDDTGEENEVGWIWIQMKTEDGTTGWILTKQWDQDWWNKTVTGIMFAQ